MSLISTNTTEKNKAEMHFGIDKTALDAEIRNVYKKQIMKMNVPGFRKGKAPFAIVQKLYGKGVFLDEAINNLIPTAYEEALKESKLSPVSKPEFEIVDSEGEDNITLKATFDLKPEVVLKQYKNLKAEQDEISVTDEMVDAEIEAARKKAAREINITDRAAETGDTATLDFEGFADGVPFDGGKAENHKLTLGSGQFIPGFEDQVAGKKIGENFDANVTFPSDYQAKELQGKAAVFKCKLNAITKEEIPALDDEFAKDMSFDTVAEYKADVAEKIKTKMEKTQEQVTENRILDALLENSEAEIPASMFEAECENQLREYDMQLRQNGLDMNTFFKYTGQTLEQVRENFRPRAERAVKVRLSLEAVVKAENISSSDEEIEAEYKRMAELYATEIDKVKNVITAEDVAADLNIKKALDLVKSNAVITVKEPVAEPVAKPEKPTADKKPVRKTVAKKTE